MTAEEKREMLGGVASKCSHDSEMKFCSRTSHYGMHSFPFAFLFFFFVLTYFVDEVFPKSKNTQQEGSLRNNI